MIKILQVLPSLNNGGVEKAALDMAYWLFNRGEEVYIAAQSGILLTQELKDKYHFFDLPLATKNPFKIITNAFKLARIIQKNQIQLIHVRSRAPAWSVKLTSFLTNVPYLTTYHGLYNNNSWIKKIYNRVMISGARVIAISKFMEEYLKKTYPDACSRICFISEGINLSKEIPNSRLDSMKIQMDVKENEKIILFPARLTPLKGHLFVIEALGQLERNHWKIVFAGDGKPFFKEELLKYAQENLKIPYIFMNHCEDMDAAYRLSACTISATQKPETFGRICVESLGHGVPVLSINQGAPKYLLEDIFGETKAQQKYLFQSQRDFIAKLDDVISMSVEERKIFHAKAGNYVQENLTLTQSCQKTYELYHDIIETQ